MNGRRFAVALRWDLQLQWRYGFFVVGIVIAVFWIAVIRSLPTADLSGLIPVFVVGNMTVTTFFFVAGLVFFEKGEGTLEALVVTPLRWSEYLGSKVVTLTVLGGVETLAIVVGVQAGGFAWLPVALSLAVMGALYTLLGFLTALRFDSVTDFLLPAGLVVALIELPLLDFLQVWESPIFYLWPTQAVLILAEASIAPVSSAELVYAGLYSAVWVAILFALAMRSFHAFVVRSTGDR
ncbi:MAG: ABC transporter permease [Proteobacteria bacterium]|nr:ABC transporter permease [Pseudomonadota bacterium]